MFTSALLLFFGVFKEKRKNNKHYTVQYCTPQAVIVDVFQNTICFCFLPRIWKVSTK